MLFARDGERENGGGVYTKAIRAARPPTRATTGLLAFAAPVKVATGALEAAE